MAKFLQNELIKSGLKQRNYISLKLVILSALVSFPAIKFFVRKKRKTQMKEFAEVLVHEFLTHENVESSCFPFADENGITAVRLIEKLKRDTENCAINVHYQPQVNFEGKVVSAEALLRFDCDGINVPPPTVVCVAKKYGIFDKLTFCILNQVCNDIIRAKNILGSCPVISVNASATQLDDKNFIDNFIDVSQKYGVIGNIAIELTEENSLVDCPNITSNLEKLKLSGISCAIDDFSMGQTSIRYLETNSFSHIKLDGSLVKLISLNPRSREIVSSIIGLGAKLGIDVIAEYVESEEVRDRLHDMGCNIYQGHLYSPALPFEKFIEFADN